MILYIRGQGIDELAHTPDHYAEPGGPTLSNDVLPLASVELPHWLAALKGTPQDELTWGPMSEREDAEHRATLPEWQLPYLPPERLFRPKLKPKAERDRIRAERAEREAAAPGRVP